MCNNLFGGNSCSWIILLLVLSCVFGTNNTSGNGCGCGCESNFANNNCGCGC